MTADVGSRRTVKRELRAPKAILWRALVGGMAAGGTLGALLVLPDAFKTQFVAPEPDTAPGVTWSALLIAVPIGALVGFMPALLGLVVWERQIPKGARRARVTGSVTAALAVVATAEVFVLLSSGFGDGWSVSGLAFVAVTALVSFSIAYVSVPAITTKRRRQPIGLST